jgi:hypothetical protein
MTDTTTTTQMMAETKRRKPRNVVNIALPPETADERQFREQVDHCHDRLKKLATEIAGEILWLRLSPRDVAITRRDAYLKLNAYRFKAAFKRAWDTCLWFQKIAIETGDKHIRRKYLPKGVFGPLKHGAGVILTRDPKLNNADVLKLVAEAPAGVPAATVNCNSYLKNGDGNEG